LLALKDLQVHPVGFDATNDLPGEDENTLPVGPHVGPSGDILSPSELLELTEIYVGLSKYDRSKLMALARRMASATGAVAANTRNQER